MSDNSSATADPFAEWGVTVEASTVVPASDEKEKKRLRSLEKTRARNRRAQATYRAKRKKEQDTLLEVKDRTLEALQLARAEHGYLTRKHAIMSRVLTLRDESLSLLMRASQATYNQVQPALEPGLTPGQIGLLCSLDHLLGFDPHASMLHGRDLETLRATELCVLGDRSRAMSDRICGKISEYESLPFADPVLLQDITTGFKNARLTLWRLFRQRPGIVAEVIRNGRPLPPNVHSAEFWLGVLSRLRLTQEQEELLDDVQARVLPQLDRIQVERRRLLKQISSTSQSIVMSSLQATLGSALKLQGITSKLHQNMEAEWKLAIIPCALFFSDHFTVIQKCRIFRYSYPVLPDVLSMCAARACARQVLKPGGPTSSSSSISY